MWKHCSSPPLLLIYAYGQPNSTHSLCSFSFSPNLDYLRHRTPPYALYPVLLQKPPTNCTHRHCTAVHLLYLIPYASIYIQYILLPPSTCFSVPTPLTPVIVTLSAQCISTKLVLSVSCIYHWMSVYILCTYTHAMYNTCCFPSPSATQPSPLPPFLSPPGRPQADGFPLMCRGSASGSFTSERDFFLARVAIVLALRGFQALGSVKRLEIIVLLWRYINKIELNRMNVCVCVWCYVV